MTRHTFIVSDESPNSYGMIIRTSGIDTSQFERNPIMYYMHERERGIVGRWENIRIEDGNLLMDAVFDESTELGRQIKQQVEGGFLRCASIGIDNLEIETSGTVKTVVKCRLVEVSIVDIPANRNAVKLYDKKGRQVYTLAALMEDDPDTLRDAILSILDLPSDATDADILSVIESLQNGRETAENSVSQALRMGLIDEIEKDQYTAMARADIAAFRALISQRTRKQAMEFPNILSDAVYKGKINFDAKPIFEQLATVAGYKAVCDILDAIPGRVSVTQMIKMNESIKNGTFSREGWGLAEYRKYAPQELQDNPQLYIDLMEREGRRIPLTGKTLDYYRRKHPEYLRAHPEEYRRALMQSKQS